MSVLPFLYLISLYEGMRHDHTTFNSMKLKFDQEATLNSLIGSEITEIIEGPYY